MTEFHVELTYEEYKAFESLLKEPQLSEEVQYFDTGTEKGYQKQFNLVVEDSIFHIIGPKRLNP